MAWIRRNNTYYYYRSKKRDGRVVQEYVGGGVIGALAWAEDERGREARAEAAEAWERERAILDGEERGIFGLFSAVEALARIALEAAGFRQHSRGRWRKRRRPMGGEVATAAGRTYDGEVFDQGRPPVPKEEVLDVFGRAGKGDADALPRLGEILAMDPERLLFIAGGDASRAVHGALLESLYGKANLRGREACELKMRRMRAELAGPHPSPIERLLAERIVTCWLDVARRDWQHASAEEAGLTTQRSEYFDRLKERANRRYLAAIRSLAAVRKMNVTAVQINIGEPTTEAAGPAAAPGVDQLGATGGSGAPGLGAGGASSAFGDGM